MKIKLSFLLMLSIVFPLIGQERPADSVLVAFWKLENFFDPFVDSTRSYNDYTEEGLQHWTASRFYRKRNNLYKAILAFSEGTAIGIFGVCEVENDFVLNALFGQTPLQRHHYRWVHYEGPDRRGIDPAIVYSLDRFRLLASEAIPYRNPDDPEAVSRDLLYAKFFDYREDTVHCFVNHWPSKYRGELETVGARNAAARILRHKVDSLQAVSPVPPKILIMGDFNDTPEAPCIRKVLGALPYTAAVETEAESPAVRSRYVGDGASPAPHEESGSAPREALVNLFADNAALGFKGTLKYRETWSVFDQIIVSKALINSNSLHCNSSDARIVNEAFLLEEDPTYHGQKLNRTYLGPSYHGGFSDHLPVVLLLRY